MGAPSKGQYEPKRTSQAWNGATICEVEPGSPAALEGLEPGMTVTHVNGVELRDMIDWQWEADGPFVQLEGVAYPGTEQEFVYECELARDLGQDWGLTFDVAVFDGMRICRNNCVFCFMKMLPRGMRRTLYMRDDDYRLSFLQGNFVTLTNVTDEDVQRILDCAISPLNVSLHAVTPEVRAKLMGKNAQRGIDVLEKLIDGGIEIHAQIVLVPDMNDGEELARTLDYVQARDEITTLGIVPLGYTKHQGAFARSYNDPVLARAVIETVRPYQVRSRAKDGRTRFQLADEFYLSAGIEVPAADEYDGFPQFHDGIGMVRSFIDDAHDLLTKDVVDKAAHMARGLGDAGASVVVVTGKAASGVIQWFVDQACLDATVSVCAVENEYFGGNVDVTGLLTAKDVLGSLPEDLSLRGVVLPGVMFNDAGLTLDGSSYEEMKREVALRGGACSASLLSPAELLDAVIEAGDATLRTSRGVSSNVVS